ncbi:MAG: hypothetical protein HY303_11325, partial [Candidatus Wallbacteria bacterium]|nr:hypothetical protein [Candidatus Wallbacteria bacterium]
EVYLSELRLQNLDTLDLSELNRLADFSGRPKLGRAVQRVTILQQAQTDDYETL